MKQLWRIFPFFISLLFGILGGFFLASKAFIASSSSIATFAGLVASATIPASILAVTLLSSQGLTTRDFHSYKSAFDKQITYLFSILFIAAALMIVVIIANLVEWKSFEKTVYFRNERQIVIYFSFINFSLSFLITLLLFRFWGLFLAIKSLFLFHAETVEREILEKETAVINQSLDQQFLEELLVQDPRENFGKVKNL